MALKLLLVLLLGGCSLYQYERSHYDPEVGQMVTNKATVWVLFGNSVKPHFSYVSEDGMIAIDLSAEAKGIDDDAVSSITEGVIIGLSKAVIPK